jgi:dephospho-CoA kinase
VAERPTLIGLTGSIGMGKTETAKMFASLGIPVFDADAAVHALYREGGAGVAAVGEAFPDTVKNGRVDRKAMVARVMNDPAAFARLEAIVHPLVALEEKVFIDAAWAKSAPLAVFDIPMLYETGGQARMDAVVVVSAPAEVQRARVLARPGMTAERLDHILKRQMPDAEKRKQADFVVDTSEGFERAFEQVKRIVQELLLKRETKHA